MTVFDAEFATINTDTVEMIAGHVRCHRWNSPVQAAGGPCNHHSAQISSTSLSVSPFHLYSSSIIRCHEDPRAQGIEQPTRMLELAYCRTIVSAICRPRSVDISSLMVSMTARQL